MCSAVWRRPERLMPAHVGASGPRLRRSWKTPNCSLTWWRAAVVCFSGSKWMETRFWPQKQRGTQTPSWTGSICHNYNIWGGFELSVWVNIGVLINFQVRVATWSKKILDCRSTGRSMFEYLPLPKRLCVRPHCFEASWQIFMAGR